MARLIPGKSIAQLKSRYFDHLNEIVRDREFTLEEDRKLLGLVDIYGDQWDIIAQKMGEENSQAIRGRYLRKLRRDLKKRSPCTPEEDKLIYHYFKQYGYQFHKIAEKIDGRTDFQVEKRFRRHIKRVFRDHIPRNNYPKSKKSTPNEKTTPNEKITPNEKSNPNEKSDQKDTNHQNHKVSQNHTNSQNNNDHQNDNSYDNDDNSNDDMSSQQDEIYLAEDDDDDDFLSLAQSNKISWEQDFFASNGNNTSMYFGIHDSTSS